MGKIIFKKVEIEYLQEFYIAGRNMFITEKSLLEKWNPGNIAKIFMEDSSLMLAAVRDKKILGISIGRISDKENNTMEIVYFGVLKHFFGTGLATELLKLSIEKARDFGMNFVRIKIDSACNKEFVSDFNEIGFIETESIKIFDLKL